MMLLMLRVMLVMLLPGAVLAQDFRPSEPPPPDFSARQYIDQRGCVFLREDDTGGWKARVSRDGAPICGYPPTFSARGLDGKPRLRALDPDAGRSPAELLEEALAEKVLTNLRPGELASDPTPMEKLPDMGPEPDISSAPSEALRAALAAAPDMRRSMGSALQPNKRLCELLGYDGTTGGSGRTDPSQGYCDSLPSADLSRLTFVRPVNSARTDTAAAGDAVAADAAQPDPAAAGAHPETAPATAPETTPAAAAKPEAQKSAPAQAAPAAAASDKKPVPKPATKPTTPLRPVLPKPQAEQKAPAASAGAKAPAPQAGTAGQQTAAPAQTQPAATPAQTQPATRPAQAQPAAATSPAPAGMIPAGARYVQVGTYANAANADRTAQTLVAMGYAVYRGKDKVGARDVQFIMAGPFNDRQSMVKALDGIRRAGFKDAYPR